MLDQILFMHCRSKAHWNPKLQNSLQSLGFRQQRDVKDVKTIVHKGMRVKLSLESRWLLVYTEVREKESECDITACIEY